MEKGSLTKSQARTVMRKAAWKLVVTDSFAEAEAETRAYWRAATPAERLNALEKLREPFYPNPSGSFSAVASSPRT